MPVKETIQIALGESEFILLSQMFKILGLPEREEISCTDFESSTTDMHHFHHRH